MLLPPELHGANVFKTAVCTLNREHGCVDHSQIDIPSHTISVYVLHHSSGGFYIGSAIHAARRIKEHRWMLLKRTHHCKRLQAAYEENPHFDATVYQLSAKEDTTVVEQRMIDLNKDNPLLLNGTYFVSLSMIGRKHSEETKRKIGFANAGRKHTSESKQKISLAKKGKKPNITPEGRAKQDRTRREFKHTEEHKKDLQQKMLGNSFALGRKRPQHEIDAIRNAQLGRPLKQEHKDKLKIAQRQSRLLRPRFHPHSRAVVIDGVRYQSKSEAGRKLGVDAETVSFRIKSKNPRFAGWIELTE